MKTFYAFIALVVFAACDSPDIEKKATEKEEKSIVKQGDYVVDKNKKKLFTGIRKSYYDKENKVLMAEVEYKDGTRDGVAVDYYENGQIRLSGGNLMGKKHGDFVYYHEDGRVYRKMSYDYGDLHGWDTLFYNSGKPKHAIPYDDGEVIEGTVEWDRRYQKVPLPKVKLRELDRIDTEGKYFLFFKFDEDVKDARFFVANMGNGTASNPQYSFEATAKLEGADEAMFAVPMQPGYEVIAKLVVRAEGVTKRGNPFKVTQVFPLVIR